MIRQKTRENYKSEYDSNPHPRWHPSPCQTEEPSAQATEPSASKLEASGSSHSPSHVERAEKGRVGYVCGERDARKRHLDSQKLLRPVLVRLPEGGSCSRCGCTEWLDLAHLYLYFEERNPIDEALCLSNSNNKKKKEEEEEKEEEKKEEEEKRRMNKKSKKRRKRRKRGGGKGRGRRRKGRVEGHRYISSSAGVTQLHSCPCMSDTAINLPLQE
ncbi:hypothetical protein PoB_003350900 [Plakobranchus ocellatus]|uniref:Uncharacterized protein n=1 Tax=Plakobranchus ocellatus TaxID=259542 RepID=A0AAV4AL94_9GAST|nr:hypothetical protein PoB_003350900 [Plakobranchus ocellatus]